MRTPFLIGLSLLLAACVADQRVLPPVTGKEVQGPLAIGKVQVPLPDGKWQVAASVISKTGATNNAIGASDRADVILFDVNEGKIRTAVRIQTNLMVNSGTRVTGFNLDPICMRKDIHFVDAPVLVLGGDQDCAWINHLRMTLSGQNISKDYALAMEYAVSNGLDIPLNMIEVGYLIADQNYFLKAAYLINPEARGFGPPQRAEWGSSDWHRDRIYSDSKKVAFIAELKKWVVEWRPKVRDGFKGRLRDNAISEENSGSPGTSTPAVDRRLKNLDQLRKDGLITEQDYQEQKQRILRDL